MIFENSKTMKKIFLGVITLFFVLPALQNEMAAFAQTPASVKGVVYYDRNINGTFDSSDKPLKGVAVSNGRDVVMTNRKGEYELPMKDNSTVFVIKPRDWSVKIDSEQIPRFYIMNSTAGLSGEKFKGLAPTGLLQNSVNFPLYPSKEPKNIKGLIFGDTQPRNDKEIYYMSQDILPDLIGTDANFGVTLGDVVFNDLNLFDHVASSLSVVGIPMWYVPGNHDADYTGKNSIEGRGAWFKKFGPNYYSFSYGPAHFIVLDNIRWNAEDEKPYSNYRTGLGDDQMKFLENEIQRLDKKQWLVIMSHIPFEESTQWVSKEEKETFYRLLAGHEKTLSLAAHTHRHYHTFVGKEQGFLGSNPLHTISVGTSCGAWWTGAPNEYGIPHAMMTDGTPNGYAFLHMNEKEWKLEWRVAGRPADFQMHIDMPDVVSKDSIGIIKVTANIFNALPDAEVKMRIGENGEWRTMKLSPQRDPARLAEKEREMKIDNAPWLKMGGTAISKHIWEADLNINSDFSQPGVYYIEIQSKDKWFVHEGKRLIQVR